MVTAFSFSAISNSAVRLTFASAKEVLKSSRPEVFLGRRVLKICSKFTGERQCRNVISREGNFIQIVLRHGCSPEICSIFSEHLFLRKTLDSCFWVLLFTDSSIHKPNLMLTNNIFFSFFLFYFGYLDSIHIRLKSHMALSSNFEVYVHSTEGFATPSNTTTRMRLASRPQLLKSSVILFSKSVCETSRSLKNIDCGDLQINKFSRCLMQACIKS